VDIVVFGGTGLIGQAFAEVALAAGHNVQIPSRQAADAPFGRVVGCALEALPALLSGLHAPYAIVNLAGESLQSGRWTAARKQQIRDSRVRLTTAIAQAIREVDVKPGAFVSGSAIGYYGNSESAIFAETDALGEGFLAQLTQEWEDAARQAEDATRVVSLRTGLVLSRRGGAFPRMVQPYRMFVGGQFGTGRQWLSWIHERDMANLLLWCIESTIVGPVNATAPNPVTMAEMGRTIAAVLHRPHWLTVPSVAIQALFGEMAQLVLEGQRVLPKAALSNGFSFVFPDIQAAVESILAT